MPTPQELERKFWDALSDDRTMMLGLHAADPFWAAPAEPWTGKRAWAGEDVAADHAIAPVEMR